MPDSIADIKALKRPIEKIDNTVRDMKNGTPTKEGIGLLYHFTGLFGQRLYFYNKAKQYTDKL